MYSSQERGYANSTTAYTAGYSQNDPYANYMSQLEQTAQYESRNASISTQTSQYAQLKQTAEPETIFLNPERPITQHIDNQEKIMSHIKKAFQKTTGKQFPEHAIKIAILSPEAFQEVHEANNGTFSPAVQGFAVNSNSRAANKIFIKQNYLDSLMLTIGHEIGHIMSHTLPDETDEEAKAFAFSMAWMEAIKQNNIAGIAECISPRPAKNGIHDKAFELVIEQAEQGKKAMEIFKEIVQGKISISSKLETIYIK